MKRIKLILLLLIIYSIQIYSQENKIIIDENNIKYLSINEVLINVPWMEGYNNTSWSDLLKFFSDDTYSIRNFYGIGEYLFGHYEIVNDNEVLLKCPSEIDIFAEGYVLEKVEELFPDKKDLLLKLDREYIDFYNIGKLSSNRSAAPSPQGMEYELNNAVVIKKSGNLKVTDILNTRQEPSINSQLTMIAVNERFGSSDLIDPYRGISLVFPGETFKYNAVSKKIDNIDGHHEPWYHIIIFLDQYVVYTWVYGGYVEEVDENEQYQGDWGVISKELIDRGYLDNKREEGGW